MLDDFNAVELFTPEGTPNIDPNGKWVSIAGIEVYHWYCCSKKHLYIDPEASQNCCKKPETRKIDDRWEETNLFDNAC